MKKLICVEERAVKDLLARIEILARIAERLLQQAESPTMEQWMDSDTVCRKLNISKSTLTYYRKNGNIPFSNIEGKNLYRKQDVEDFLKVRTTECE